MTRRYLVPVALAVILLGLLIGGTVVLQSRTLARRTLRLSGQTVLLRVTRKDGGISASAQELSGWSRNGWSVEARLAEIDEVDATVASIEPGIVPGQALIRVGDRQWSVDVVNRRFESR